MQHLLLQTEKFLDDLLNYNWNKFNDLDWCEQSSVFIKFIQEFKRIINQHKDYNKEILFQNIMSYQEAFEKLTIKGKNKHLFPPICIDNNGKSHFHNGAFIPSKLITVIKDIEYKDKRASLKSNCDCKLAFQYHKTPNQKDFEKIGWIHDGYYYPKVYKCSSCGFKWKSYVLDDDLGKTVWDKLTQKDTNGLVHY